MSARDPANSPPLSRLLATFFAGGALLFGAERLILPGEDSSRHVVVTRAVKAHLTRELAGELGREPTAGELGRRVERYGLEEVAYREGVRAGMDRSAAVRNEVVRAYRGLAAQLALVPEPSAAELEQFLAEHRQAYVRPDGTLLPAEPLRDALRADFRERALREADTRALRTAAREYEFVEAQP